MTVKEFVDVMALNDKIVNIDMRFVGCKSTVSLVWEYKGERVTSVDDVEYFGDCAILRTEIDHDISYSDSYEPYVTNIDTTFTIYIDYDDENIKSD